MGEPTVGDILRDPLRRMLLAEGMAEIQDRYEEAVRAGCIPGHSYWCDRCHRVHYASSGIGLKHSTPAMRTLAERWNAALERNADEEADDD